MKFRKFAGRMALTLALCLPMLAWSAPDPVQFGFAVERGDLRLVQRWLDEGLSPEYEADRVGTGLMIAAWNGNVEMMALFIARGADPKSSNRHGEQPLQLAAWGGHRDAVRWLLEKGAPLDRQGLAWSALHYAVFNGHLDLARELIALGAAVNARSPNGSTPLMLAAREGREELAMAMLKAGGDPAARNDWGDTALTLAMRYDHYRLGKMIASSDEFAVAAKAPKESFSAPSRSARAPSEIDELLRQLREAQAEGRPTDALREKLAAAVNAFKAGAGPTPQNARRPAPQPFQPKSLVITARRGQPGAERAEVVAAGATGPVPNGASVSAARPVPAARSTSPAEISELLRRIRIEEAEGRSTIELQKQLSEAVENLRR